jgi:hypothetical protein
MDWLREAGHQAIDSYQPDSKTVRDSCLDDVDTCDLYVLVLGHRYGFQPEKDNPERLSITRMEFRRAASKPRVALLRTYIPDTKLSDLEDPQKAPLVTAFRAEVADAVRAAEFHDTQELLQALRTGVVKELEKQLDGHRTVNQTLRLGPRMTLEGREELLAKLDVRLAEAPGSGPRVVVLCGLAGKGKTSAAVEYAHRHKAELGVAWQIPAQNAALLAAGFGELAAHLGAGDMAGDTVAWVHGALAAYPAGWLLIFDDVPGPGLVQRFLPLGGTGRVLITSSNTLWPPGQAVEVPPLGAEFAADFLASRTSDPDKEAARELARELRRLPLALDLAAAYIQATGSSLAAYLALFRKQRADLLSRGQAPAYSVEVATTWALTLTQLEQSCPGAVGLLRLLAFCAPEAVPWHLLLRARPGLAEELSPEVARVLGPLSDDELAAEDAVEALRQYSLVCQAREGEEAVSVHRLVQAITADQMPAGLAEAWRQAAAVVIEAAIPDNPQQVDSWPVFAALLPHAQAALAADSNGMQRVAIYLENRGSDAAARELWRELLEERIRALGPEHTDTLIARAKVASFTGQAGDAAGARDQLAALLPMAERVLGADHSSTLAVRSDLARWTGRAGDAAAARDQYAALLPDRERVSGPEHPDTQDDRDNLYRWTGEAGDVAEARARFAALPLRERVSSPSTRTP